MTISEKILVQDVESILRHCDLTSLANKTVLITGASGLIGSYSAHTVISLRQNGIPVEKLVLVVQSPLPSYLQTFYGQTWVEVHQGDLSDMNFIHLLPDADIILHAAGYAQPSRFMDAKVQTIRINTLATGALLDKLRSGGKFLFASSSAVYTGLTEIPFPETKIGNSNTNHSRSCYIEGKRCGEALVYAYRSSGVDAKIARFSIIYGPGVRRCDQRALYTFIREAMERSKIELLDDGSAQKVYCYITDAVEMLWNILLHGMSDIYNISGHSQTSILDLAKKIGTYMGAEVTTKGEASVGVPGTIVTEWLNTDKIETEFGKKTYVDLNIGLHKTIDWFCDVYGKRV